MYLSSSGCASCANSAIPRDVTHFSFGVVLKALWAFHYAGLTLMAFQVRIASVRVWKAYGVVGIVFRWALWMIHAVVVRAFGSLDLRTLRSVTFYASSKVRTPVQADRAFFETSATTDATKERIAHTWVWQHSGV